MGDLVKLSIKIPSGESPLVEYGRHFNVQGEIEHEIPIPEDGILTIRLVDSDGRVVRYTRQNKKNNPNVYLNHPDFTAYPEEIDSGRKGVLDFGFPELMVKDIEHPMDSLRDATIKCWYSDEEYKSVIVSATGVEQGSIFEDGIGYLNDKGEPYQVLGMGDYTIEVEFTDAKGIVLARTEKRIRIGEQVSQAIVRFNPRKHRERMTDWCQKMNFAISNDTLPGYLETYKGTWLYHMGLLTMYRACDIALYRKAKVHMFVYLVDPTSTSYETELAYLQTQRVVGNPERFTAYHYDIGEALIGEGRNYKQRGKIVEFPKDKYLAICRVDLVNEKAKENCFDLGEESVERMFTDLSQVALPVGATFAVTGVVKPWQLMPEFFELRRDNTYKIKDSVCEVHYEFDDGQNIQKETRTLLMERIDKGLSIGSSVYEFYNIFSVKPSWKGRTVTIRVTACDKSGENNCTFSERTSLLRLYVSKEERLYY